MITLYKVAFKNLSKKKNRTLLTMFGIALSSWVLISLLGFNAGYEKSLDKDIDNLGFQLMLTAKGCPYEAATLMLQGGGGMRYLPESILDNLSNDKEVAQLTPMVMHAVFDPFRGEMGGMSGYLGINPDSFQQMKPFLTFQQGQWMSNSPAFEAVLGYEAAELEQREVGDFLLIPDQDVEIKIVGILDRSGTQDDGTIFMHYKTVQSIFGLEEQITGVGIKVHREADVIAYEERLYSLPDVQVVSMAQVKNTISTLVATARVMVMSITIIAILISMIGVINTILMSVLERYQEIGIMKTMGATTSHIFRIIWFETFMICIIGGLVGALGAVLLANGTDSLIRIIMPYSPTNTMIHITSELVLKSLGIITLIGLFSGIYPAYKATIIIPINAIKSEGEI